MTLKKGSASKRLKKMPKIPLDIACCIILDNKNRILLLKRHADDLGGSLWAPPGGTQEKDEDPAITIVREIKEETGVKLNSVLYLGAHELKMPHGVAHMKSYLAHVKGPQKIALDKEEHEDFKWFDIKSLLKQDQIIWGLPTTLQDFALIDSFDKDPTLADGSQAILIDRAL